MIVTEIKAADANCDDHDGSRMRGDRDASDDGEHGIWRRV